MYEDVSYEPLSFLVDENNITIYSVFLRCLQMCTRGTSDTTRYDKNDNAQVFKTLKQKGLGDNTIRAYTNALKHFLNYLQESHFEKGSLDAHQVSSCKVKNVNHYLIEILPPRVNSIESIQTASSAFAFILYLPVDAWRV